MGLESISKPPHFHIYSKLRMEAFDILPLSSKSHWEWWHWNLLAIHGQKKRILTICSKMNHRPLPICKFFEQPSSLSRTAAPTSKDHAGNWSLMCVWEELQVTPLPPPPSGNHSRGGGRGLPLADPSPACMSIEDSRHATAGPLHHTPWFPVLELKRKGRTKKTKKQIWNTK